MQFLWTEPSLASALPNIYDRTQLEEFCAAPDAAPLTAQELAAIQDLYARNFDLTPQEIAA